jgi:hypothetical protein
MNPEQIPLRDLHLPEAIGWWPPAPGWWVLLGLLVAGLILLARALHRHHQRGAARRLALAELARLERTYGMNGNTAALAVRTSDLLRRAMLAYAPRGEVAGLTGRAWLEWLDRGLDRQPFSRGPGRTLGDLPYRNPAQLHEDVDVDGLIEAVRRRLHTPLPENA